MYNLKSILCYQRGQRAINETQLRVLAAFVGGISYLCFPKLTILSYALLETGRTIGGKYKTDKRNRLGITDVIFPFALAYIIHTYVFYPKKISGLGGIIIDSTTANYGSNIRTCRIYPFCAENSCILLNSLKLAESIHFVQRILVFF
ncbi:uncharacterized protein LOC132784213 [Drosophila nasuta]|uniref:uncharacterized protein LOC132784213 n=1 Tax=Drosophila nasuta TaxID=42062 RepID=UPI00295E995D|nr:uncharacterized protein LOC132784213 [Drosophila nasuta]